MIFGSSLVSQFSQEKLWENRYYHVNVHFDILQIILLANSSVRENTHHGDEIKNINRGLKVCLMRQTILKLEPVHEKTNNLGFRPGLTQTGLYSHRRWLEA